MYKASLVQGDPILSFILVRPGEEQTVIPISAEEPAQYYRWLEKDLVLPDRVSVNMSDGSKRLIEGRLGRHGRLQTLLTPLRFRALLRELLLPLRFL